MQLEERVEAGTASTAEREQYAQARAHLKPVTDRIALHARTVWAPAMAAWRMPCPSARYGGTARPQSCSLTLEGVALALAREHDPASVALPVAPGHARPAATTPPNHR